MSMIIIIIIIIFYYYYNNRIEPSDMDFFLLTLQFRGISEGTRPLHSRTWTRV